MQTAIGLDVGGTKILGVLMDEKQHVLRACRASTMAKWGREFVLNAMLRVIKELTNFAKTNGFTVSGIGIGLPGIVPKQGRLDVMPNIPSLSGYDLRKRFAPLGHIILENDANCFALAEAKIGAARTYKNVAGVIWGTGVGGALVREGTLISGSRGAACELGHTQVYGVELESLISGPNIIKRYKQLKGKLKSPSPASVQKSNEPKAVRLMLEIIDEFAMGLANLATLFDVDAIVLGGGVSNLPVYGALRQKFKKYAFAPVKDTKILKASLGSEAGVFGAALLALHE